MAAHRYWRAVGLEAYGAGDLELSCFHLLDAAGNRVDAAATLSANIAPSTGALANLQDDDLTTAARWPAQSVARLVLQWDFGGSPANVTDIRLAGGSAPRFLLSVKIQWSSDAVVWVDAFPVLGIAYPGAAILTASYVEPDFSSVAFSSRFNGLVGSATVVDACGNDYKLYGASLSGPKGGRRSSIDFLGGNINPSGLNVAVPTSAHPLHLTATDFTIETYIWLASEPTAEGHGLWGFGGGLDYSWPTIRLHFYGAYGLTVGLRSNATEGDPDIANFVTLQDIFPGMRQWVHVAMTRQGSVFRLWVGGVQKYQVISALPLHDYWGTASGVNLGSTGADAGKSLQPTYGAPASYSDFLITRSCKYTSNFTPRNLPVSGITTNVVQGRVESTDPITIGTGPAIIYGIPQLQEPVRLGVESGAVKDFITGVLGKGIGRVRGTVKLKADPVNTPLKRRVRLIRERDGLQVRETWSDPITGIYDFPYIDELQTWTVVSYDYTHDKRAVIADGLSLENGGVELMP